MTAPMVRRTWQNVERQPRERAVPCPFHSPRYPVETWNLSGLCDRHEASA